MEYLGTDKLVNKIQPTVSVCVPTYQHVKYINQCLASILNQQIKVPYEIIIGEDESTDGTRAICMHYAEKYPDKIRLFLRSRADVISINGLASGRFNFMECLKAARGEYVALCEGDDYWCDEKKLQQQFNFLNEHKDFSMTVHNSEIVDEQGKWIGRYGNWHEDLVLTHNDFHKKILAGPTASYFFRNDFNLPTWFDKVYGADAALYFLLSKKGKILCQAKIMSVYRKHSTSIESNFRGMAVSALRKAELYFFYFRLTWKFDLLKKTMFAAANYLWRSIKHGDFYSFIKIGKSFSRAVKLPIKD